MDSRDRFIPATMIKTNLPNFANIDPTISRHLLRDVQMLLATLTPEVWQRSPGGTWAAPKPFNQRQLTLEWLQEWCFVRSMGVNKPRRQRLINDQHHGLSRTFTTDLHQANHGIGYWDAGWQVVERLEDGYLQVKRDRLVVEIERHCHLPPHQQHCQMGDYVSIKMPKNVVVDDCYVAIANAGVPSGQCVELFFHLMATGAAMLMRQLSQAFNATNKPFRLALSYLPEAYPRRDAGVLQIAIADYGWVRSLLRQIYPELQPHLQPEVPLWSWAIAPGIGVLEPTSATMQRYQCLAEAILTTHLTCPSSAAQQLEQVVNDLMENLAAAGFERDYWHCAAGDRRDYERL